MSWFGLYLRGMDAEETNPLEGERGRAEGAAGGRPHRRWPVAVGRAVGIGLVAVFAVIGVAATGYVALNGFPQDQSAEACSNDRQAAEAFMQRATSLNAPQSPEARYEARLWARVIAGAPDCFDAKDVAAAREYLDRG